MSDRRQQIFERWKRHDYDVLVVGGGITGAGIVRDAALRGLRCALVEKGDFASGTSSKSGKLIHGGLRYLKQFHFRLVWEACRERWRLLHKVAPHLVQPVQFVVPFYRSSHTPRWLLACGLVLYDALAMFRNAGRFRFLSPAAVARLEPQLERRDGVGGLSYWDARCLDFRLVIDTLKSAAAAGADVLNYAELERLERMPGGWSAGVRDVLRDERQTMQARVVVNAAGPWADEVQQRAGAGERFGLKLTAGIHLVFARRRFPVQQTLALEVAADRRMIYVEPWGETVLVGTTDTFYSGDLDRAEVEAEAAAYLLDTLNRYFPEAQLTAADVRRSFVGLRPLVGSDQGLREEELPRDDQMLVRDDGLVSITGGKLTTYRAMAERVVDVVLRKFFVDRAWAPCKTIAPISGGQQAAPRGASPRLLALWERYGDNAPVIESLIAASPELGERIDASSPYLWAEVVYAVEHEYAECVEDVVDRRLGAFLLAPDAPLAERVAAFLDRRRLASNGPSESRRRPA